MEPIIKLSSGGGGEEQRSLIELIRQRLDNPYLAPLEDAAVLTPPEPDCALAFTTDSYVVRPYRFPGGDIGSLAVCGTVNDLAVMGAVPRWLSLGFIIEEGFPLGELEHVLGSIASHAEQAGVCIATGDTKVVEHGKGDGLYINTSGIGWRPSERDFGVHRIAPDQSIILSGNLGEHAIAVMLAREALGFSGQVMSDCAPLNKMIETMIDAVGFTDVFAMRDLTRGGLAAALNEYARSAAVDIFIDEPSLPVKPVVRTVSRALGFEPAVLANEGKIIAVVSAQRAEAAVQALRSDEYGRDACIIGRTAVINGNAHDHKPLRRPLVLFNTATGGQRVIDMPLGDLLPRIC